MSSVEEKVVYYLQKLGLSGNAAKTYLSLLKNNPATGYEISAQSDIPRSAIYAVLNRLEGMSLINSDGGSPKRYIPIGPSSLIEHFEHVHDENVSSLKTALDTIDLDEEAFDFWHIHGYRSLVLKMREACNNSSNQIVVNAWNKEIVTFKKELLAAEARGVDVILFSFSRLDIDLKTVICYRLDEADLKRIWRPKVVMVVDQNVTIMGGARNVVANRAIWTTNPAITQIAQDYIILDITLAGPRLNFDPNPIVKRIMRRRDYHLDRLLDQQAAVQE